MDKYLQIIKESKKVKTNFPINQLSLNRWSPRSFDNKIIEKEKLMTIFESARWAGSAFNEQPWRFIIGFNGDKTFNKIFDTLIEFNQSWAKNASVLILNIYKTHYSHNNMLNKEAMYDLGQAVGTYCLEAVNQDLVTHQITGFDEDKANTEFQLGEDYSSMSITALGHLATPDDLPAELFKIELQNRMRKPLNSLVFTDNIEKTPLS